MQMSDTITAILACASFAFSWRSSSGFSSRAVVRQGMVKPKAPCCKSDRSIDDNTHRADRLRLNFACLSPRVASVSQGITF